MAENAKTNNTSISFKDTLNLPTTDFPIRPNAHVDDPALIERWEKEGLFHKTYVHNQGAPKFVLHDGPPYANGNIHAGSMYNKVLKDIVSKCQRMQGKHVPVMPGWDCHGLPIEIKVTQESPSLKGADLKKACRAYAQKWIEIQRIEFKRMGVLMDWDNYYSTMSYAYEAAIIHGFGEFVAKGYINRSNKTVPWCFSCKTVLAMAEIEYYDRKDPSVYVLFPLKQSVVDEMFPNLAGEHVSFVVWTTTPWTLPLNRAVLLKPHAAYVVLEVKGAYVIVGEALTDKLCATLGVEKKIFARFVSDDLIDHAAQAKHPLTERYVPVLLDESVSLEDGTACVHNAPGAGPIDYEIGVKNNLEIYSPVDDDGTYTDAIEPQELVGMPVTEGQWWVLKKLQENGLLLHKTNITHSYPHCWRCRNGLIFRATKQWFFNLQAHNLKERALEEIETVTSYPEKAINRLSTMVRGRFEWCLSRQRSWGVPIPALLCTSCDTPYVTKTFADMVSNYVAQEGIEWWDNVPVETLMTSEIICAHCNSRSFKKEKDIVDVWLESGLSHYAVLEQHTELGVPADLYLEGSDQHRAWFQSSLLTSVALYDKAPYKALFTHCFVVDGKGQKMSKSLGNVIAPSELLATYGTDTVRLWVASLDNASEAVLSNTLLKNVQEVFRKIRNTLRFLLSNLYDFDKDRDSISFDQLRALDMYALQELSEVNDTIIDYYNTFNLTGVFHKLGDYCATELSAFYLDISKDRLYVEKADSHARRSAQTVCWAILDTLTRLVAPILSFTAEQISDLYQKNKTHSIHLQNFVTIHALSFTSLLRQQWQVGLKLRDALLKALEEKREIGLIKHSLEARVTLYVDPQAPEYALLKAFFDRVSTSQQSLDAFLKEFIIVSQFVVQPNKGDLKQSPLFEGVYISVEKARGEKCPRCWQWTETKHAHNLCDRCNEIVNQ